MLAAVGAIFVVMMLGGAAGVCWWWGVGFDEAERLGMATPSTDAAMVTSFWVALAGAVGLAATGAFAAVVATRASRRALTESASRGETFPAERP